MDDRSVSRLLANLAPTLERNFIVVDVKANLVADERKAAVSRFVGFRTVARVMMGEPTAEFKNSVHEAMLQEKKAITEAKAKQKKTEATKDAKGREEAVFLE